MMEKEWMRIGGYWYKRGGIKIDVLYKKGEEKLNVWIKEKGVEKYRGSGQSIEKSVKRFGEKMR